MASRKRIVLCYILLQASFWGMISSICAYQAAIVLDRGFTTGQAGIFCALCYLASLFTQPVIGGWADRHPSVPIKQLLIVMLLPAVALNLVFYFTRPGFLLTALIIFLFGVLETNSYPLIDSMGMQYVNAATAVRTAGLLWEAGILVPPEAVRAGLWRTVLPARQQYVAKKDVLVDGAHNADSLRFLHDTLRTRYAGRRKVLIAAAMQEKDVSYFHKMAADQFERVYATQMAYDRCRPAAELAKVFEGAAPVEVLVDEELMTRPLLGVHPCDNTATLWITPQQLSLFLSSRGNAVTFAAI